MEERLLGGSSIILAKLVGFSFFSSLFWVGDRLELWCLNLQKGLSFSIEKFTSW